MQEDILGTRQTVVPNHYVQCIRCSRPVSREQAQIVPSDAFADERSEYEYLCPNCQAELASGEKDISTATE